jgi:small subunit ribosomal protein S13
MSQGFNYLVRIHGTNLDGTKSIPYALCDIKGIGIRVGRSIVKKLGFDPSKQLGSLSDSEIRSIEKFLEKPAEIGLPKWMLNRRKDRETGRDIHLISSDMELVMKQDIEFMKEMRSWKGHRHSLGLKVRGQRTKTTARKGRSVGVSRKRILREEAEKR